MGEQDDAYSLYKAATRELLNRIGQDDQLYSNALVYQHRLSENIEQSQLYGETDTHKAERNRIISELNKLALTKLGVSFNELCKQVALSEAQERTEISPTIITDPVSLVELHSEGPVWRILKSIKEARVHSRWDEILSFCDQAIRCETRHPDRSARATAQFYMADALARSDRLKEGTDEAERARKNFRVQRNHRNMILADLMLTFLKLKAREDLRYVRLDYVAIRDHCRELESKAKENPQSCKAERQFYGQIIEGIQQALEHIDQSLANEVAQSCCLNAIPILQLFDGPDRISQPADAINYFATDAFKFEGRVFLLHPLDTAHTYTPELKEGATHFALPVPEDDWPIPTSKRERDFALVRAHYTQEGPGVRWTGQEWVTGQFKRDAETGQFYFVEIPKRHIIGGEVIQKKVAETEREVTSEEYGYVIGLLKPEGSVDMSLDS